MSANGSPVTHAELAAHIRRIDENLAAINKKLDAPGRWVGARVSRLFDWGLVAALAATVATAVRTIG